MGFPSHGGKVGSRAQSRTIRVATGAGGMGNLADSIFEIESIQKRLQGIKRKLGNLSDLWPTIGNTIIMGIDENFRSAGKNGPGQWKDLSGTTKRKRAERGTSDGARFPGQPILNETGAMYDSIGVYRTTDKDLMVTATDPKALIHEFGLTTDHKNYERPFMYISDDTAESIFIYVKGYIDDLIAKGVYSKSNIARTKRGNQGTFMGRGSSVGTQTFADFSSGFSEDPGF